jgi:GPH family glycoside/pentoside/hexuronide:cation symporter
VVYSQCMGSSQAQHTTSGRLPLPQLAAYGAGGIIPIALFNIAGILVGLMGNISLGLSAFWLGVVLIIPRLWDAVVDPVIGHLSDNTRTRWGRRRPFLLIGGILVAVFFVVMWWIPTHDTVRAWFPTDAGYQWFQLSYILVTLTLFFTSVTLFEIPHSALGAELTADSHQRTRLFSAKSFVGNLFAMSTPWLFVLANMEVFKGPGGNEADGMRYVSLLVAAIVVPLSFWWFFTLREPGFKKAARQEKSPFWQDMKRTIRNRNFIRLTLTIFSLAMGFNFVQLLGSYIPIFYVFGGDKAAGARLLGINGTVWAITGLLAVFPLDWISPRIGKRNTLIVAISLIGVAQLSKVFCYNPAYPYLIVIPTMLLSCGMLFFFTLGSSMVGDICDEDELQTGYRAEGSYYSVFWWFIKMGTALASLISGALIVLTLFDETQVTKVDKLQGEVRALIAQPSGGDLQEKLANASKNAAELHTYLEGKVATAGKSSEHYRSLAQTTEQVRAALSGLHATAPGESLKQQLTAVEKNTVELTKQPPYTLFLMRIVEIGLPLIACLISLLFVMGYALTEARSREIKDELARRHAEHDGGAQPAVV